MRNGKIVEYGPAKDIFANPQTDLYQGFDGGGFPYGDQGRRNKTMSDTKGNILLATTDWDPKSG